MMKISFLGGGYLNELGPFEPGAEIVVPNDQAEQLIANGLATAILPQCVQPIRITLTQQGGDDV